MKVKIKKGDILLPGEYELTDRSKLDRAKRDAGSSASGRDILIAYDKIAGRIVDPQGSVVQPQSLWRIEIKHKIVKRLVKGKELQTNSKYGEFIIQTNKVQWLLVLQILSRAPNPNDELKKVLEIFTFGPLISAFRICAYATSEEEKIIDLLAKYKGARDALAHKMFTDRRLTPRECITAIKIGNKIIKYLTKNMKNTLKLRIKGADKINEFPEKFNKLVKRVESLELKLKKVESKGKEKNK